MHKLTTLSSVVSGDGARPRPTMRDVAALAGVSLKTVSRVINAEPAVSTDVQGRVLRAIAQLDYRPNLAASNLRRSGGKTATLGLVLEDLANPYSAAIIRAVEDTARPRGVTVVAGSVDEDPARERALAEDFISRRVDGLVVVPASTDHSYLASERRSGLPVVFVDRPPRNLDADAVVAANRDGAQAGVAHLIAAGHRRIAFIGDLPSISTAADRYAGYLDALGRAGLDDDPGLVRRGVRASRRRRPRRSNCSRSTGLRRRSSPRRTSSRSERSPRFDGSVGGRASPWSASMTSRSPISSTRVSRSSPRIPWRWADWLRRSSSGAWTATARRRRTSSSPPA